jgi:hypothetical protein
MSFLNAIREKLKEFRFKRQPPIQQLEDKIEVLKKSIEYDKNAFNIWIETNQKRPLDQLKAEWREDHSYQRFDEDMNDLDKLEQIEDLQNQISRIDKLEEIKQLQTEINRIRQSSEIDKSEKMRILQEEIGRLLTQIYRIDELARLQREINRIRQSSEIGKSENVERLQRIIDGIKQSEQRLQTGIGIGIDRGIDRLNLSEEEVDKLQYIRRRQEEIDKLKQSVKQSGGKRVKSVKSVKRKNKKNTKTNKSRRRRCKTIYKNDLRKN